VPAAVPARRCRALPISSPGGTTLIDLMRLDVMRPEHIIDINPLAASVLGRIDVADRGIRLGALVRMAQAADHPQIRRAAPAVGTRLGSLPVSPSRSLRHQRGPGCHRRDRPQIRSKWCAPHVSFGSITSVRARAAHFRSYPRKPTFACTAISDAEGQELP
jgi:hypothetical protein